LPVVAIDADDVDGAVVAFVSAQVQPGAREVEGWPEALLEAQHLGVEAA
jgi:hypothetical protein